MPWKYKEEIIREGVSWAGLNGVKHPSNWSIWTDKEKEAAGLVWEEPQKEESYDERFWFNANTPKPLEDLKQTWREVVSRSVSSLLKPTDYVHIKKAEDSSYEIPESLLTYRQNVRKTAATIKEAINNATDHESFVALFKEGSNGKSMINDWPEKE